jgi:hypothetical protein
MLDIFAQWLAYCFAEKRTKGIIGATEKCIFLGKNFGKISAKKWIYENLPKNL